MNQTIENLTTSFLHDGVLCTFVRVPHVKANTESLRAAGADVAILGFPWDATCASRTGTNLGPKGIRDASQQFGLFSVCHEVDLSDHYTMVDCGDIPVFPGNAERTMQEAQPIIAEVLAAGALPVVLGGDHAVNIPCTRAFAKHHAAPGMIQIDTHLDIAKDVNGESIHQGTPIARAVDAGFDPKNMVTIGPSGWLNTQSELEYLRELGVTLFTIDDVIKEGAVEIARKAVAIAGNGTDSTYLTIDIDAVDAAYAPGTGVPAAGGLTSREVLQLVYEISKAGIGGLDIVEVSPPWDINSITSTLATRIILDALLGNATR